MTTVVWDQIGDRVYESGIDHCVLYVNGLAVPWNGISSVAEKSDGGALTQHYIDGQKYADLLTGENYRATIQAYTYPEAFEACMGIADYTTGFSATRQPRRRFNFTYRTKVSNDLDVDLGYKIHLVYNATALPSEVTYSTLSQESTPVNFQWDVVASPVPIPGMKPTAHLVIDTNDFPSEDISTLEEILYGTSTQNGSMPLPFDLIQIINGFTVIVDIGGGQWMAIGPDDDITVDINDSFTIDNVSVVNLDADTYIVSSLNE